MRFPRFATLATPLVCLTLTLPLGLRPAAAQSQATHESHQSHSHSHSHGDPHSRDNALNDAIYKGYFDNGQISDRPLADWQGDWQSVYPLLLDGRLDGVMAHKAEAGDMTAAEYRDYYDIGYKTDVSRITIIGDEVSFYRGDQVIKGRYSPDGHEVLTYKKGNRGVRFIFVKSEGDAAAPKYIQFSDHRISPSASDHFHLYWGDDRAKLLEEVTNWPTYYPADLSSEAVAEEMMAH